MYSGEHIESAMAEGNFGIVPTSIHIPSLNLSAFVESSGLNQDGELPVPLTGESAVWYSNTSKPGAIGNSVIAGHVDDFSGPALFFDLQHLLIGDEIIIEGEGGYTFTFEVVSIESYPRNSAPISHIFGFSSKPQLNLITCHGVFDQKLGTHEERLVVYTTLAESQ